jgi:hypothetical protein
LNGGLTIHIAGVVLVVDNGRTRVVEVLLVAAVESVAVVTTDDGSTVSLVV